MGIVLFFNPVNLGDLLSPGPLASPHARYEGLRNCVLCHEMLGGVPDERCLACHREVQPSLAEPLTYHSRAKVPCFRCHSDHRGRDFRLVSMDEKAFSHDRETTYPLKGKHAGLPCVKCHTGDRSPRYRGLHRDCGGCHRDIHYPSRDRQEADPMKNRQGRWGDSCEGCHQEQSWEPVRGYWTRMDLDHGKTRLPLVGRHIRVPCHDCHRRGKTVSYRDIPRHCSGCHQDPHRPSWGDDCRQCHGAASWRPRDEFWKKPGFDHARFSYRLEGGHLKATCPSCHLNGRWKGLKYDHCNDCHSDQHQMQFPGRDCRECHTLSAWRPSTFHHPEGVAGNGYRYPSRNRQQVETMKNRHPSRDRQEAEAEGHRSSIRDRQEAEPKEYRLDPLHDGVKCEQCHPPIDKEEEAQEASNQPLAAILPEPLDRKVSVVSKVRYRPLDGTCRGCHRDSDQFYRGFYPGIPLHPLPEAKSEAVECQACHDPSNRREKKGKDRLMKEAMEGCVRCHNDSYGKLFLRWQEILREKETRLEIELERLKHQTMDAPTDHGLLLFYSEAERARHFLKKERYHNLLLANSIYDYYLGREKISFGSIP